MLRFSSMHESIFKSEIYYFQRNQKSKIYIYSRYIKCINYISDYIKYICKY